MFNTDSSLFFRVLLGCTFLIYSTLGYGQNQLQGIVNSYASVEEVIGNCTLVCDTTTGFKANDRLLIIQMKGAVIDTSNNSNYGDVLDLANAGVYEFASIQAVIKDTIFLSHELVRNYDVNDLVQVVGLPKYKSFQVSGDVTGKQWDGKKGGIVFLEATDTIELNANIIADSIGFQGGSYSESGDVECSFSDYYSNFERGFGGKKGESIVAYGFNDSGRGSFATGGGGGNNHNSGGGGGANFGSGGLGGKQAKGCGSSAPNEGGFGGKPYQYAIQSRLYLGGGGGGGHQNRSTQASDGVSSFGGHGGGLVIISSNTLLHNGNSISANGQNVTKIAENDGAGGGGGGGTVFFNINHVEDNLQVSAKGGNGGNVDNEKRLNDYHGPGGGGGGGVIFTLDSVINKIDAQLDAGEAGILYFNNHPEIIVTGGENYGSEDGIDGGIVNEISYPEGTVPCPIVSNFRAQDVFIEIIEGQIVTIPVNPKTDTLILSINTNPLIGNIDEVSINEVIYQSFLNNIGTDSIQYTLCNTTEPIICTSAWIRILVRPDTRIVIATNDTVNIVDTPVSIASNDTTDTPVTYQIVEAPKYGEYTLDSDGNLNYTPLISYDIPDTLTYSICTVEAPSKCDTATVIINSNLTNFPPIAVRDTANTEKNQSVLFNPILNDSDPNNDSIFIDSIEQPLNGTATLLADGTIEYIPNSDFSGIDSIQYTIRDNGNPSYSSKGTIIINVIDFIDIKVPTGISPNNDGINDLLIVEGLNLLSDNTIRIFNRWGEEIYFASPYKNDWNGTNNQGEPMPDGTYFYVLTSNTIKNNFSGYVIIHR